MVLTWRNLASNLAPDSPTWSNLAPTCPNLVPTWPQQGPTWPNRAQLGPKLVPKLINLASTWPNLVPSWLSQLPPTWPQLASQFVTHWHKLAYNLQWTTQAQRSMRGGGGAGDSPRGRLRSGAPEGVCCVEPETKSFRNVDYCQITGHPGRFTGSTFFHPYPKFVATWTNFGSMMVQLGSLVGYVRPSCPTWLLLGSNLVHVCQLSANLAQLGPILAQLGSNLVQFCSQLGPTWSQNVTKMNL